MALVAEYVQGESVLHRLSPMTKMAWLAGLGVLCVCFSAVFPLAVLFLLAVVLSFFGKVQKNLFGFLRGFAWVAATIFLVQVFFFHGGRVYFRLVPAWSWTAVTEAGIRFGVAMVLRTLAMTSLIPLLLCTTELKDLVVALVEKVRFPAEYALMLVTILRFIPTFLGELEQITMAQRARGFKNDGRFPWQKWKGLLPLTIPLVRNALVRAQELAVAMQLRGYSGGKRSFLRSVEMGKMDWAAIALLSALLVSGAGARLLGVA